MDILNKLYHDVKKHKNDNDTLTAFEQMAFQVRCRPINVC